MKQAAQVEIVEVDEPVSTSRRGLRSNPAPHRISASRLPLDSIEHCRREMARVYREMRAGTLAPSDGTRLVYALGELCKLIMAGQLESRITALEGYAGAMAHETIGEDL